MPENTTATPTPEAITEALAALQPLLDDAWEYRVGEVTGCQECADEPGAELCGDHADDVATFAQYEDAVGLVRRVLGGGA